MRPIALLALPLLVFAPPLLAKSDVAAGAALYSRYCATCHGATGAGDGPTAQIVLLPPPDLTGLAAENGGSFPFRQVILRIDGREALIAHGSPMPIYGAFFEGDDRQRIETADGPVDVAPPVLAIARYLATLQTE
ncbi:cytochrome c [Tropicimonas sp. IMCC6043]|uniref:c-type cytochrome n=1 Tax=Tropicimonas sp. IMCC6043 TaxID=2510645 RepID=UPI001F5D41DB|nr:cytochrome c [Tropicimonas sp. IMCC6043]